MRWTLAFLIFLPTIAMSDPTTEQRELVALEIAEKFLRSPPSKVYDRDQQGLLRPAGNELKSVRDGREPSWTPDKQPGIDEAVAVFVAGIEALESIRTAPLATVVIEPEPQPDPEPEPEPEPEPQPEPEESDDVTMPAGVTNMPSPEAPAVDDEQLGPDTQAWLAWREQHDVINELDARAQEGNDIADESSVAIWENTGTLGPSWSGSATYETDAPGYAGPAFDTSGNGQLHTSSGNVTGQTLTIVHGNFGPDAVSEARLVSVNSLGDRVELLHINDNIIVYANGSYVNPGLFVDTAPHTWAIWADGANGRVYRDAQLVATGTINGPANGLRAGNWHGGSRGSNGFITYAAQLQGIASVAELEQGLQLFEAYQAEPFTTSVNGAGTTFEPTWEATPEIQTERTIYGNSALTVNDVGNIVMKAGDPFAMTFSILEPLDLVEMKFEIRRNDEGNGGGSYSGGTGGQLDISLQALDAGGHPDGTPIVSTTFTPDLLNGAMRSGGGQKSEAFTVPATSLAAGGYAIVVDNVDPDPVSNFVSLNGPLFWDFGSTLDERYQADPARPTRGIQRKINGTWVWGSSTGEATAVHYLPAHTLTGADGTVVGQEIRYGEAQTSQTPITATSPVRQRITPDGGMTNAYLNIAVGKSAGDGPLRVSIDGTLLGELDGLQAVPDPAEMHRRGETHFRWFRMPVPDGTVSAGQERIILLESPNGSHRICAGSRENSVPTNSSGRAERVVAGQWQGWRVFSNEDAGNVQLCLFFSGDTVQ